MAYTAPPTFVASDPLAAAELNVLSDDISFLYARSEGTTYSGCSVQKASGTTSVPHDTETALAFASEYLDIGAWWSSGTDVIVPAGAVPSGYTQIAVDIYARCRFAANGTGTRALIVYVNGTSIASPNISAISGETMTMVYPEVAIVEAGDVITLGVKQTSGGALDVSNYRLTVQRRGPVA